MKTKSFALLGGLLWLFALPSVRAGLIGDNLTFSHYYPNLTTQGRYETHNRTVAAGPADALNMLGAYRVDAEDDTLRVDFTRHSFWSATPFNGLVLSRINDVVLGYELTTNLAGWNAGRHYFEEHAIYLNWQGLTAQADSFIQLTLLLDHHEPVPETGGALVLLGAGCLTLAAGRRRCGIG
jgi:hypothetical protein